MPEPLTREEIVKRLEVLMEHNPEKWAAAVLDVLSHLKTELLRYATVHKPTVLSRRAAGAVRDSPLPANAGGTLD